ARSLACGPRAPSRITVAETPAGALARPSRDVPGGSGAHPQDDLAANAPLLQPAMGLGHLLEGQDAVQGGAQLAALDQGPQCVQLVPGPLEEEAVDRQVPEVGRAQVDLPAQDAHHAAVGPGDLEAPAQHVAAHRIQHQVDAPAVRLPLDDLDEVLVAVVDDAIG